ncbi:hypothetical protein ACFQXB_00650 [Plastorhodobacter daqingensis]|uniref:Translation initiation factor 2 n=1 Tax=Plastorhodobacter daqingensis TaxID=1387281 RepID=A0ABW2UGN7_9RHOB
MIRTISIGSYISVQGTFVRQLPNGKLAVRVGEKTFVGTPVSSGKRSAA